jgi:hypothetical protein
MVFQKVTFLLPEEEPFIEQARDKLIELMGIAGNQKLLLQTDKSIN